MSRSPYGLALKTAAAAAVLSTAEAKSYARIDDSTDDTLVDALVSACTALVERKTFRRLVNSTWYLYLDEFPCNEIIVPYAPLSSVTAITYTDTNGDSQTLSTDVYAVDTAREPGRITLKYAQVFPATRPIENAVRVEYVAGYGAAASAVPEALRLAVRQLVVESYDARNPEPVISSTVDRLLWAYRVPEFA